jgi:hypothetical protein
MSKPAVAEKAIRLMPDPYNLGSHFNFSVGHAILRWEKNDPEDNPTGKRTVMGFPLPDWQRPLVWTEAQQIKFLESAWLGLPLGTYTYNQLWEPRHLDGLLIDGQQRLYSIERYLCDAFPVFGYKWSDVTEVDKRRFGISVNFPAYVTKSADENYLRDYYNLMNYSGTAHTEDQRAYPAP